MATVARHIDKFVTQRKLLQVFLVGDFNTGIESVPECRQPPLHHLDGYVGTVGDNLIKITVSLGAGFVNAQIVFFAAPGNSRLHSGFEDQLSHQRLPVGHIRTQSGGALFNQTAGEHRLQIIYNFVIRLLSGNTAPVADNPGKTYQGFTAVKQDREEAPGSAGNLPGVRKQYL